MTKKHLHEQLGLTFQEFGALLGTRNLLATGMLSVAPVDPAGEDYADYRGLGDNGKEQHFFDMNIAGQVHGCSTVGCIGGTMAFLMGRDMGEYTGDFASSEIYGDKPIAKLFYPSSYEGSWCRITPEQAVKAIDQWLNSKGKHAWRGILKSSK